MKKHYKRIIFACIALVTTQVWSQSPANPGFEYLNDYNTDWKNTPNGGTALAIGARSNTVFRTGQYSYLSASVNTTGLWNHKNASTLSIAPNAYAHVIAWAKRFNAQSRAGLGGTLGGVDNNGGTALLATDDWTRLTSYNKQNTTAGALNFQCLLMFRSEVAGTATKVYFDDVIVYTDNVAAPDLTNPTAATASTSPATTSNSVTTNWTNGTDAGTGIQNTLILRTTNMNAASPALNNQGIYSTAGGASGPNTVSTDWTVISTSVAAGATSFTDNAVSASTAYKYAVFHRDMAYNYSSALVITAITNLSTQVNVADLPSCPTCDLAVAAGGTLDINATKSYKSITVAPTAKLTLNSGTLTLTNGITLESDANGTATLIDNYSEPTVNATVKQYLSSARNWYFTPAVSGVVVPASSTYFGYDEAGGNFDLSASGASAYWKPYSTGASLTAGKGYIVQPGSATTLSFTSTTNSGDVSSVLTYNGDNGKGYNLVGNPYPSYLNWSAVYDYDFNNGKTANIPTGTIWYRTVNYNGNSAWLPNTTYNQNAIVYNGTRFYRATSATGISAATTGPTGTGTGISDGSVVWNYEGSVYVFATVSASGDAVPSFVSNLIPPMQAFWVKTTTGGGTLRFKNSMRSHNTDVGSNLLKAPKSTVNEMPRVRLHVSNGASADEAVIYASTNASKALDSYDAPKYFNSTGSNQAEIYSQAGNEKLAINALNEIGAGTEIAIGFATEKANNFSISATELKNISSNMQVVLKDKQINTEFDLGNEQVYIFSSAATSNESRFSLIFKSKGTTANIDNSPKTSAQVFVNVANKINILAPEKSNYAIYNAVGMLIENGVLNYKLYTVNYKLVQGMYIVKVNNQSKRVIVK